MVEAMGSHIDVERTPGVGTRFVFKLPAASKSAG